MNEKPVSSGRRQFLSTGLAVGLGALSPSAFSAPKGYGIEGKLAPELDVPQWIDGEGQPGSFTLAEHRGKFVFLECWQAWCPGCHSHGFPALQKIYAQFKDNEYFIAAGIQTTFEGYASNTSDKLRVMQKRYDLPIAMGHDQGNPETHSRPNTMRSYRTGGTPWAILISPDGVVVYNDFSIDADNAIAFLQKETDKLGV